MYKTDSFISADEIKEIVGISKSKAYSLIQELNSELKEKGYLTVTGRVSRKYFEERFYGLVEKEQEEMHFKLQKASSLDMTFGVFYKIYEQDVKPKVRYNTWCSKQHIIETKLLPYFKNLVMPDTVAKEMKDFLDSIYGLEQEDRIFPISKSYLHHEMDRGVKESGVKRIRIHDLRHSHVSLSQGYFWDSLSDCLR